MKTLLAAAAIAAATITSASAVEDKVELDTFTLEPHGAGQWFSTLVIKMTNGDGNAPIARATAECVLFDKAQKGISIVTVYIEHIAPGQSAYGESVDITTIKPESASCRVTRLQ